MNADPTIVFVSKLLALFIGVEMANILAPQFVIVVAGAGGATFGVMEWRQSTRVEAAWYVARFTLAAWLFAGILSNLAAWAWEMPHSQYLLSPIAWGIGWIGHRWPKVGAWAAGVIRTVIERRAQQ